MPVAVSTVVANILTDLTQPSDGSGNVTRNTLLRYIDDAQKTFNDITLILRTGTIIQAIEDQIEYDLPESFKTGLRRCEYDKKFLTKQNKDWFDLNDSQWRDPLITNSLDATPLYWTNEMVEEGKFLIYPPAESDGESRSVYTNNGQIKRSLTFGSTTTNLFTSNGQIKRTITVNGEIFELFTGGGNIVRAIVPRDNNFYIEYVEEPADLTLTGNVAPRLEKYRRVLEWYAKSRYYESRETLEDDKKSDRYLARFTDEAALVKINLRRARSKLPRDIRPVIKRHQLSSKQIHLTA